MLFKNVLAGTIPLFLFLIFAAVAVHSQTNPTPLIPDPKPHLKFLETLQNIKDPQKRSLLKQLDSGIASVSTKRNSNMSQVLKKLQTILDKITSKKDALSQQGVNTTTADIAITKARTQLTLAHDTVSSQSAREYIISLDNPDKLKTTVTDLLTQQQKDLKDTKQTLIDAKKAIRQAAKIVAMLENTEKGGDNGKKAPNASSSGN